jgi:hypothetical protein
MVSRRGIEPAATELGARDALHLALTVRRASALVMRCVPGAISIGACSGAIRTNPKLTTTAYEGGAKSGSSGNSGRWGSPHPVRDTPSRVRRVAAPLISDDNREAAVDLGRAADRCCFRQRASITLFFEESIP